MLKEIKILIQKELILEWRQRDVFSGLVLYIISTVFVVYMGFQGNVQKVTLWNTLYWIILLFSATNVIAKSFIQENEEKQHYYFTLASTQSIILSKMIYNTLLMIIIAFSGLLVFIAVFGNPIQDVGLFILNMILGALGFSSTFTMIAGIASKARNNGTIMAVLSFPLIIPMLLLLIKISKNAIDGLERSVSKQELLSLLALNMIVMTLSYILFPYTWRT